MLLLGSLPVVYACHLRLETLSITLPRTCVVPFTSVALLTSYRLEREIKAGLQYDCSSDLWSLGSLILWMLDPSRVFFPSRTPLHFGRVNKGPILQESAPRFDTIRPKGDLGTLVSRLLEKVSDSG